MNYHSKVFNNQRENHKIALPCEHAKHRLETDKDILGTRITLPM